MIETSIQTFLRGLTSQNDSENKGVEHSVLKKDKKTFKDRNNETDLGLKKLYGIVVLCILVGWCLFVGVICWNHMQYNCGKLSDSVLITLLSTTTINIVGLPLAVLHYLFPKR